MWLMFFSPVRKGFSQITLPALMMRLMPSMEAGMPPTTISGPMEEWRSFECAR